MAAQICGRLFWRWKVGIKLERYISGQFRPCVKLSPLAPANHPDTSDNPQGTARSNYSCFFGAFAGLMGISNDSVVVSGTILIGWAGCPT